MSIPLHEIFDNDSIFYSWQDDIDKEINRHFIKAALKKALNGLSAKFTIAEDMRDIPGTPILPDTLFSKIEKSYSFIGDISFCCKSDKRKFPNPNVMLELGYAVKTLGWERIILVLNESTGSPSELPVDILDRRHPIIYNFALNESEKDISQRELSKDLCKALKVIIDAPLSSAEDAIRKLDGPSLLVLQYYLTKKNEDYPSPNVTVFGAAIGKLDFSTFSSGCARLLDLELIRTFLQTHINSYRYYLTRKGRLVCKMLGYFD
jgi:hypothetical protein